MSTPVVAPSNHFHPAHALDTPNPPNSKTTHCPTPDPVDPHIPAPTHDLTPHPFDSLTPTSTDAPTPQRFDSNTPAPTAALTPQPFDPHTPAPTAVVAPQPFDPHTPDAVQSRTLSRTPGHLLPHNREHRQGHTIQRFRSRSFRGLRTRTERGAATAEYAVTIVAACGLGGILVALLKSPVMQNALKALINYALKLAGVEGVHL
jgi:hypothetical protein